MKKNILTTLFAATILLCNAQLTDNAHLSFYEQLIQTGGNVQGDGSSRAIVYKQISYRTDLWNNPGSAWVFSDSANYTYNTNAQTTLALAYYYATGMWNNGTKNTTAYNSNGLKELLVGQQWIGHLGTYRNDNQLALTYDANNNLIQELRQSWDTVNTVWVNSVKSIMVYNGNNHMIEFTAQQWNTGTSNWDNLSHATYTRDANGNMLTYINQVWNSGTVAWQNSSKSIRTYNANNSLTSLIEQNWNNTFNSWDNAYQYTYTYDGNNNLSYIATLTWSTINSAWEDLYRRNNVYDAGNRLLSFLREYYYNNAWGNNDRGVNTYDSYGNQLTSEFWGWNNTSSQWVPSYRFTNNYDGNNNQIYEFQESYNTNNLTYENYLRRYYHYQAFNVADVTNVKNELNASVFPNPASSILLQFGLSQTAPVTVNVYDATGRLLINQNQTAATGTNNLKVEASTLATGNYFVQLINQSTNKSSVIKFVKQ